MSGFIAIDQRSGVPFYRQIIDAILAAIATGSVAPGARLPTVRQLAINLQVNPNTVARAYRELEIRGIVQTQRGTGTFVADRPETVRNEARRRARVEQYCAGIVTESAKLGIALQDIVEELQDRAGDRR